eukprot:ctg_1709.g615
MSSGACPPAAAFFVGGGVAAGADYALHHTDGYGGHSGHLRADRGGDIVGADCATVVPVLSGVCALVVGAGHGSERSGGGHLHRGGGRCGRAGYGAAAQGVHRVYSDSDLCRGAGAVRADRGAHPQRQDRPRWLLNGAGEGGDGARDPTGRALDAELSAGCNEAQTVGSGRTAYRRPSGAWRTVKPSRLGRLSVLIGSKLRYAPAPSRRLPRLRVPLRPTMCPRIRSASRGVAALLTSTPCRGGGLRRTTGWWRGKVVEAHGGRCNGRRGSEGVPAPIRTCDEPRGGGCGPHRLVAMGALRRGSSAPRTILYEHRQQQQQQQQQQRSAVRIGYSRRVAHLRRRPSAGRGRVAGAAALGERPVGATDGGLVDGAERWHAGAGGVRAGATTSTDQLCGAGCTGGDGDRWAIRSRQRGGAGGPAAHRVSRAGVGARPHSHLVSPPRGGRHGEGGADGAADGPGAASGAGARLRVE